MATNCKNCNQSIEGNFCSNCGQTTHTHEINWHFLLHDIQHGFFHFDNGIFFTIKELFTRPGYTIKEFIEGKRVKHFKPISFLIVLATLYGFLIHFLGIAESNQITYDKASKEVIQIKEIVEWFSVHYAFTSLILLPFYSLSTYWAFKSEKYNFIQHVVLNAYLSGQHIILRLLFIPVRLLFGKDASPQIFDIPDFISVAYTIWALWQFFDHLRYKKRFWKIVLSYVYLGIIFLLLLVLIVAAIGIFISKGK